MTRTSPLLAALLLAAATSNPPPDSGGRTAPSPIAPPTALAKVEPGSGSPVRPAPVSFRFPDAERDTLEQAPPFDLTASDGTGLRLVAVEANGVLEPPLAFTELRLTFENPQDRTIEGRFRIAMPSGAALSRFAMKIDGVWQEGEVVERQRARVAYEDFLHRRQDPALLEHEAGNEFSARVFPIPARARKELIVSYSHALPSASEPYTIPLRGLPAIGALDLRVLLGEKAAATAATSSLGGEVREKRLIELHKRDWTPDRDFTVGQDLLSSRGGLRHENLLVVRVTPPVASEPQPVDGLYVLVDSSASRALGYAAQVDRIAELVSGLRGGAGEATPLALAAFDQEVVPIFAGTAGDFGDSELARLRARRPLGASDLQQALTWLGTRLAGQLGRYPRVLLVTDGVATAGEVETAALRGAVHALAASGVQRLDVLATGGLRDDQVLRELVTGNLPHDGQRIDARASRTEVARRLSHACRSGIRVGVEGARWVWPETLDGVQAGDQALVFADLQATTPPQLTLDGKPYATDGAIATAERPLLEREWAQARIGRLLHLRETSHADDLDLRQALTLEVTELSVEHRVLTPFTALLVLETEADYARFGLDRRALADILTVGPGGLDVAARTGSRAQPAIDKLARRDERSVPTTIDGVVRHPRQAAVGDAARATVATGPESAASPETVEDQITVTAESPLVDGEFAGEVAGGIEGGVVGGVAGGVAGGTPGGFIAGREAQEAPSTPPPPPPSPLAAPAPTAPVEIAERVEEVVTETRQRAARRPNRDVAPEPARDEKRPENGAYTGPFAEVMAQIAAKRTSRARALAEAWVDEAPGDVLALLALGEAWEATGDLSGASRAYGSLIDLFPSRADLRRLAGERLERLGKPGQELAIDTYQKAVLQRPDHPAGHRLLAWALLRAGRFEEAFAALEKGLEQHYPGGRFAGVDRVLREDLGLLAAAWLRAEPGRRAAVLERLEAHEATLAHEPSLRFVLTWETDANDVDLHVYDRRNEHAYYSHPTLPSGGKLFADVTTGYGPECFAIDGRSAGAAAPYRLAVHYYSRGPMGYGMGTVQIVTHDGKGDLRIEPRPFVVMNDQAMVEVGAVSPMVAATGK